MEEKYYEPICPRCGSTDTRSLRKSTIITCRRCGYTAHWRQFFRGQKERDKVKKMFIEGKLEGNQVE